MSQLGATLRVTELVGGVSMLYGMLLHQGAPPRSSQAGPPTLPPHTVAVARATLRLLREVAEMDLALFQVSRPHLKNEVYFNASLRVSCPIFVSMKLLPGAT